MKLELDAPNIGKLEKEYLNRTIDSGFVSTFGPYVTEFEEKFASYLGVEKAVSIQSGTAALHMAMLNLGIGKDDEVIVPAFTFIATVNPIVYVQATPVFVDVDRNTWNMMPDAVESAITKKTKAILPVHIYGNPCEMDEINSIAKRHGLYVIEDATESLGAVYRGSHTGTFGDFGCFSFNGNKVITTGGGGMIVGKDRKRLEHIKFLVNQARDESKGYYYTEIGFNYRMTNIEASLGLAQMKRLEELLAKKKRSREIYSEELSGVKEVAFQKTCQNAESSWWLTCITLDGCTGMEVLQAGLKEKGIPTRRLFMPVCEFKPYALYKRRDHKNASYLYEHGICLPSSTLNSESDIVAACKAIKEML